MLRQEHPYPCFCTKKSSSSDSQIKRNEKDLPKSRSTLRFSSLVVGSGLSSNDCWQSWSSLKYRQAFIVYRIQFSSVEYFQCPVYSGQSCISCFLAILGDGRKLFIKSDQILIIFSLLIDEKRRKKRIIPKLPTSKPASIGVSARILLASGLPLIDARAPLTTNIRLATKCNYRNTVASYRNFYKQFCFFYRFKTSFNLNRRLSVFSCYSHRHKSILSAMASEVRDDLHLTSTGKGHYYRSPHGFPPQGFRVSFSLIFL